MKNRVIASILAFSMLLPLAGCGGGQKQQSLSEKLLAEAVLNEENLFLEIQGVELKLHPAIFTNDVNASIYKVSNAPYLDEEGDIELDVYDFRLDGMNKVEGVIQLTVPMSLPEGNIPGAAYLDEATGQWEPVAFHYDKATSSVIIKTDHLSKYGVFSVANEGSRRARIEFLGLFGDDKDEEFAAAIEEYSIGGVPGSQCLEIGVGAAGDALQIGGDILGGMVQGAGYLAYGEDVLSTVGDHLGSIGLLLSVVQIGNSIYNGNINEAVVGSLKTSFSYVLGKVTSKLSSSVMSASMASVAIIDYSINKFGTTAIEGRADIYREAYSIYYQKGRPGYKGSNYWFDTFYPMFNDPGMTEEELKAKIDEIVTSHCNEFWVPGINKDGVEAYMSEARENLKFTGGAGLNQGLQDTISQERRAILYNDVLPGVFSFIAQTINMNNENRLRAQYKELADYLNTSVSFSAKDPKKTYAKHLVRFSPLNDKALVDNWTGKIRDDGSLNTSFTLYGHMYAGAPNGIDIYKPEADLDKDAPIKTVKFMVSPPEVEVVLSEDTDKFASLVIDRTAEELTSTLLQVDEYKSAYYDDVYPVPLQHMLTQQPIPISEEDGVQAFLQGSWAAETVSGDSDAGEWSTSYRYDIEKFELDITNNQFLELPIAGTDRKALLLDGSGTYSYQVTVTTVIEGKQEALALFEKAWVSARKTNTTTFTSSGEVLLYSLSNAIDGSKPVNLTDTSIENLETTKIVLEFLNPTSQIHGTVDHYSKTVWEDEQEKEETETYDIPNLYASNIIKSGDKIYFRYPAQ